MITHQSEILFLGKKVGGGMYTPCTARGELRHVDILYVHVLVCETFGLHTRMGLCFCQVPVFPRVLNPFHLPDDPGIPVVMIGPGTGVSPFIGFLEHRQRQKDVMLEDKTYNVGKAWLFFGCRHPDKDYLFR